jgi:hypothetical protein
MHSLALSQRIARLALGASITSSEITATVTPELPLPDLDGLSDEALHQLQTILHSAGIKASEAEVGTQCC